MYILMTGQNVLLIVVAYRKIIFDEPFLFIEQKEYGGAELPKEFEKLLAK